MSLTRGQPNVEVALSIQPDVAQQELRKPTIGGRKPQAKRLGVGRLFIITFVHVSVNNCMSCKWMQYAGSLDGC